MQTTALRKNIFLEYISWLKNLELNVEYAKENDGTVSGYVSELCTMDNAPTREECEKKLIAGLRETAETFLEDFYFWATGRPYEVPYVLKILYSTDEEIKSCLRGKS